MKGANILQYVQELKRLENKAKSGKGTFTPQDEIRRQQLANFLSAQLKKKKGINLDKPVNNKQLIKPLINIKVAFKDEKEFSQSYAKNITGGGLYFESTQNLILGSRVKLTMLFQNRNESIVVNGEIVWESNKNDLKNKNLKRYGVKFIDMEENVKELINNILLMASDSKSLDIFEKKATKVNKTPSKPPTNKEGVSLKKKVETHKVNDEITFDDASIGINPLFELSGDDVTIQAGAPLYEGQLNFTKNENDLFLETDNLEKSKIKNQKSSINPNNIPPSFSMDSLELELEGDVTIRNPEGLKRTQANSLKNVSLEGTVPKSVDKKGTLFEVPNPKSKKDYFGENEKIATYFKDLKKIKEEYSYKETSWPIGPYVEKFLISLVTLYIAHFVLSSLIHNISMSSNYDIALLFNLLGALVITLTYTFLENDQPNKENFKDNILKGVLSGSIGIFLISAVFVIVNIGLWSLAYKPSSFVLGNTPGNEVKNGLLFVLEGIGRGIFTGSLLSVFLFLKSKARNS